MTRKARTTWFIILNVILSHILEINQSVLQVVSVGWVPGEADFVTEFRSRHINQRASLGISVEERGKKQDKADEEGKLHGRPEQGTQELKWPVRVAVH